MLTNTTVYEKDMLPRVIFEQFLPTIWEDCRIVETEDIGWSALVKFNCAGQLQAPDGSHWSLEAVFRINGEPHLGRLFTGSTAPWEFRSWQAV